MIGSLDTHELVKDLKAAGFNEEQAEAVTRAVSKARSGANCWRGVTPEIALCRVDLLNFRTDMFKVLAITAWMQTTALLVILRLLF